MSATPLQQALAWFAERDEMGGFKTAARELFPGWAPKRSCRAPHREEKNASFSVYRSQKSDWRFKDFGTGEHGGLVGFAMLAGMDGKQASHWLMEKAGVRWSERFVTFTRPVKIESKPTEAEKAPEMSPAVRGAWKEGVDHLHRHPEGVGALVALRGWPLAWAKFLADRAHVSMPLYHGRRTIAFLVETPEIGPEGMTMRGVGFHCRLAPRPGENHAGWRYVPNEAEHGQRIPALPFIMGGSCFDSAKLLVILGGQWDALTFAFSAGWLGDGCQWPDGVCVIGMRGDSSSNIFLHHYGRFWPKAANCLLIPDGDASGARWLEAADSFASRLSARCRKVAVVRCGRHKDFNDLYRAEQITPVHIEGLLASHKMTLEGGQSK